MIRFPLTRTRAVLAGAAVLGMSAAVTLAAWSDAEFASGFFSFQPRLVVESAMSQTGPYASHTTAAGAAELGFAFPAEGLQPGEPVQAERWLRLVSDVPASVSLSAPEIESHELDDRIEVTVTDAPCGQPGNAVQSGPLGGLQQATGVFTLPAATPSGPGEARPVCVTAELVNIEGLQAGQPYSSGSVNWTFVLTEIEA